MPRVLRVLLICGSYPPIKCGVGDYTAQLAIALAKRPDTNVAVITDVGARRANNLDAGIEFFPIVSGWRFREVSRIFRLILSWKPDVVHMQFGSSQFHLKIMPWLLPAILSIRGVTVVQTWHEWPEDLLRIFRNFPNTLACSGLVVVKPEIETSMTSMYRWLIRHKIFRFIPNASAIPRMPLSECERTFIRSQLTKGAEKLVVFFGFANSRKGVTDIFEIADPNVSSIALLCELEPSNSYHRLLLNRINSDPWCGKVTVTGFLPPEDVGRILAVADAVILPFPNGGGSWSTSTHAVVAQGTFVIVTSYHTNGYDVDDNVYYAKPKNIVEMREAMRLYAGKKIEPRTNQSCQWAKIADSHITLYQDVLESIRL